MKWVVIGILVAAMAVCAVLRIQQIDSHLYGMDAYWNMRGVQYLVENGIVAYYNWNDSLSWYPDGRNVTATSQVVLQILAAATYMPFSFIGLQDWLVVFPVIAGVATIPFVFLFVRNITNEKYAMLAVVIFAVLPGLLLRGMAGFLKGEPVGILLLFVSLWLLVSGIKKCGWIRGILGGFVFACALSAWPGVQFFLIPMLISVIAYPLIAKDKRVFIVFASFFGMMLASVMLFERPGLGFVMGLQGLAVMGTVYVAVCMVLFRTVHGYRKIACLVAIGVAVFAGSGYVLTGGVELPSQRYLSVFGMSDDVLLHSVAEHMVLFDPGLIIMCVVSLVAAVMIIVKGWRRADTHGRLMTVFGLSSAVLGTVVFMSYSRLMLFGELSFMILACTIPVMLNGKSSTAKIVMVLVVLLPVMYGIITFTYDIAPAPILTGGTFYSTGDWIDALDWIKHNTPKDSKIAAWWDYGYWIGTVGERATFMDGSTHDADRIAELAQYFVATPEVGHEGLKRIGADYVLVFAVVHDVGVTPEKKAMYRLGYEGDEGKITWIGQIAGKPLEGWRAWENTTLGHLVPMEFDIYGASDGRVSHTPDVGLEPLYTKRYLDSDLFELVYESPSGNNGSLAQTLILIYQVK